MVIRRDYIKEMVDAARSVLIEVIQALGEYRDSIVLIGGWAPEFIIGKKNTPYVGSLDVDLALDHRMLTEEGYKNIRYLLLSCGYEQGRQPFIYSRRFLNKNREIIVEVNLFSDVYGGMERDYSHPQIQGVFTEKARGCELAFDDPIEVRVEGEMPGGGKGTVTIRVASMVTFLVMKGMAMGVRLKEKDAWDIYYCVKNYSDDIDELVEIFRPHTGHGLAREGLEKIAGCFASEGDTGPGFVADFEEVTDFEERAFLQRDAYERVSYLIEKLRIG